MDEEKINEIVELLAKNEVLFEITALDLGLHTEDGVKAYKKQHGEEMLAKAGNFAVEVRADVQKASQEILDISVPLYLQALTTFDVLHRLIGYMPTFFAQRRPKELGTICWMVDGKDPKRVTRWEKWWSNFAVGALATMSIRRPSLHLEGGDYSHFDNSYGTKAGDGEQGTDLKQLLKDIKFSSNTEVGLELVDILTNAVRRTLAGNLQKEGWQNIHKLMIHRNDESYVRFVLFGKDEDIVQQADYGRVVQQGFTQGGKQMLTPQNLRQADKELAEKAAQEGKAG